MGGCGEEPPATDDDAGPEDFLFFVVYSSSYFILPDFLSFAINVSKLFLGTSKQIKFVCH